MIEGSTPESAAESAREFILKALEAGENVHVHTYPPSEFMSGSLAFRPHTSD